VDVATLYVARVEINAGVTAASFDVAVHVPFVFTAVMMVRPDIVARSVPFVLVANVVQRTITAATLPVAIVTDSRLVAVPLDAVMFSFPGIKIRSTNVLSAVVLAGPVLYPLRRTAAFPPPVDIPGEHVMSPPPSSVPPIAAPPPWIVKGVPSPASVRDGPPSTDVCDMLVILAYHRFVTVRQKSNVTQASLQNKANELF
jgi:hypothetical protein